MLLLYGFLFNLVVALRRDLRAAARAEPAAPAGAAMPRLASGRLIVLDPGASGISDGQSFRLADELVIGRAPDSDLRIEDTLVSARHARLYGVDGRWFLRDLGSTNGTLLNQEPLEGERQVEFGDIIEVGSVRLKLAR